MKIKITALLILLFGLVCFAQIEIMNDFQLGEFGVGFKNERITDYSRSFDHDYRSVQLFLWYPTQDRSQKAIQYEQYFGFNDPAGKWSDPGSMSKRIDSMVSKEVRKLNEVNNLPVELSKYKMLKTIAQIEAPFMEGQFPLLLFAPGGNTSSQLHSVICEYLASHGYIVASFPSLGNTGSQKWPFNQVGLNLQIDDMSLVINHLKQNMSQVNIDKTGLIAWSVGGVSQGIYSMKNSNIDMFISLDSGLGRVYGLNMLKESPYFNYANFQIPYLHFTGDQPETYKVERSSEFYDSIPSVHKHSLVIKEFAHQHFPSQLGIIPALASDPMDKKIVDAYKRMCRLVLVFSNRHLKNSGAADKEWMKLIKN
ncbi:hypothetical protein [Lutimonas zeaxanthinifaciens]|uniref:alpha/beta hydrolase n=1 Tax=Lutimonas zeaxanthinifaciens TaxID=3060215 RepID=UPI00265CFD5C|nr:hypothetical protein [Lutimonas sp. YSD2104]WKK67130.1 hypothetical protein QZH61_05780 [Lutimonas sp. YSD2104]